MGVCRFYRAGLCKFGAKCHNQHEIKTQKLVSKPRELKLPHDNLSRDFRFVVPSPTIERDVMFFSSDSDWDEKDDNFDDLGKIFERQ